MHEAAVELEPDDGGLVGIGATTEPEGEGELGVDREFGAQARPWVHFEKQRVGGVYCRAISYNWKS